MNRGMGRSSCEYPFYTPAIEKKRISWKEHDERGPNVHCLQHILQVSINDSFSGMGGVVGVDEDEGRHL